jgi:putative flippase GtrA
MSVRRTLFQLLKFGISGVLGVAVSTLLFYGLKGALPDYAWTFWAHTVDLVEVGFYELTTIVGGTIHFLLSKIWVFEK